MPLPAGAVQESSVDAASNKGPDDSRDKSPGATELVLGGLPRNLASKGGDAPWAVGQGGQAATGGRSHCPYAGSDGQKLRLALCGQGWGSAVQADAVDGPKNRRPCDGQCSALSPLQVSCFSKLALLLAKAF